MSNDKARTLGGSPVVRENVEKEAEKAAKFFHHLVLSGVHQQYAADITVAWIRGKMWGLSDVG